MQSSVVAPSALPNAQGVQPLVGSIILQNLWAAGGFFALWGTWKSYTGLLGPHHPLGEDFFGRGCGIGD